MQTILFKCTVLLYQCFLGHGFSVYVLLGYKILRQKPNVQIQVICGTD